ncbi:zinc finger BED domain-containing protein DAYSLEEPER-like [Arachis ipaensis]|nr:zinc finger BED domain-containing protein DAYSLEEPER-like [Arachis ipaensis]
MARKDLPKMMDAFLSSSMSNITKSTGKINTFVATFRRLVDSLGTIKDTPDHRQKLHNTRQRISRLVKDISAKLKSLSEFDRHASVANRLVQHQPTQHPTSEELSIGKIKFKAFNLVIKFTITSLRLSCSWTTFVISLSKPKSKMIENSNIEAVGMSASTQPSSPPSSVRKNRSAVWDHFDVENATGKKAKCKYCGRLIQYGNGTDSMGGHLRRCKQNPNNDSNKRRKTTTTPTIDERGVLNSPSASKFDQEEARRALVEMFIGEGLPFRFVESPKFRRFVHVLQAKFKVPSRTTLARDIGALYAEKKMKLQDFLSANCGRVCLTTDTWTSISKFYLYDFDSTLC